MMSRGRYGCTVGFRLTFPKSVWLNPEPEQLWQYRQSISVIRQIAGGKVFSP